VSSPCRMIIDVDPGIDDAMAIFYAVRRPGIKLEALTTTFGNTDTAIATDNALRVLELLGRADIPVAQGVGRSFIHPYVRRADHVHGSNAIGDVELPQAAARATGEHASDLIIRMAKESPCEITLCPVGPVTNLALAPQSLRGCQVEPHMSANIVLWYAEAVTMRFAEVQLPEA
jgi:purine nucleosidase